MVWVYIGIGYFKRRILYYKSKINRMERGIVYMKQSKKLLRVHKSFLSKKGISREVIESMRFYKETVDGEYIFVKDEELVKYDAESKSLRSVNKDGLFK